MGITQAQLSRIENGPPIVHLDRLAQWARVLRIPADLLWFALPDPTNEEEEHVDRRNFLGSAGMTVTAHIVPTLLDTGSQTYAESAQRLAWHMWQRNDDKAHQDDLPTHLLHRLADHADVVTDVNGYLRFTDPAVIDVLVAQRVFGSINVGASHLLATAQTSHAIDLSIGAMTAQHQSAQRALVGWMRQGATAVLRVNAAGVLAKVGTPDLADASILALRADPDARHLYLTAVVSRVLSMPWGQAADVAAAAQHSNLSEHQTAWTAERLAAELSNTRDAAARWCSSVLLSKMRDTAPDFVRSALVLAAQREPCRENLRAYTGVLAGSNLAIN
jgi:transcriptional regulator with XRE-family HTH domain